MNDGTVSHFLFNEASHILVGVVAALVGVLAHRAWFRRRWRRAPAAVVIEAVLTVDIVNSTWLATHHGEDLAMRARSLLERRAQSAAQANGVTFVENTGDGSMMTFATVDAAARAARKLLRGLRDRPPDLSPGPPLEVRAAITYGQILIDSRGSRHGATINEAFRLMSVASDAFVSIWVIEKGHLALEQLGAGDTRFAHLLSLERGERGRGAALADAVATPISDRRVGMLCD